MIEFLAKKTEIENSDNSYLITQKVCELSVKVFDFAKIEYNNVLNFVHYYNSEILLVIFEGLENLKHTLP